nr:hypothetical protein [Geodermatophilus africanus]
MKKASPGQWHRRRRTARMQVIWQQDTKPQLALRRALLARELRYRVDY